MQIPAFSKINLILEVLEKRPDGYHNLRSVMQTLELHDTLTFRAETPAGGPAFQLTCSDPALPTDERNLVTRAALYILERYKIRDTIAIHIEKRIPVAAGLGGGSSNCAAALVGFNRLIGLDMPSEELCEIGLRFGADVPFFIKGGTALAEGIGERLTPLPNHPPCWVVLACLPAAVSTADIFGRYVPGNSLQPPDFLRMKEALEAENTRDVARHFYNNLTSITTRLHPEIDTLINKMKHLGALNAAMSGSGPSVFGYFDDETAAKTAAETLSKNMHIFLTRPCTRKDENP